MAADLQHELDIAEIKAWAALAESKYLIFGYWSDMWDYVNRLGDFNKTSPFVPLVNLARAVNNEKLANNPLVQSLGRR